MAEHGHSHETFAAGIALIAVLGVASQWLAWRFRLPSVLLLMTAGFVAGPVTGVLDPAMFGGALLPMVSLAVGLVLFEGGLSLRFHEIRDTRKAVVRLVTVGALIAWAAIALLARLLLGLPWSLAILLGALLTVTGPTVIIPMLRSLRLTSRPASVVKWEGIIIDPIMVVCAVLVYEAMLTDATSTATFAVVEGLVKTIVLGGAFGVLGAALIYLPLRFRAVPDFLHIPLAIAVFAVCFVLPNGLQGESGLVSVTLMGVLLANQKSVSLNHIIEFKEHIRTLIIAALFIVLTARLSLADFAAAGPMSLVFAAALIVAVRPLSVFGAAAGTSLAKRERAFLAAMAPRGIVAASLTSIFAERLTAAGFAEAAAMTPVTIVVVASTVAFYGLTAPIAARRLGLSQENPQGILVMGGHEWARRIAAAVTEAGFRALIVDTNWKHIARARMEGLPAAHGSILGEDIFERLDLAGIGRMIALTRNEQANALAAVRFVELFGRAEVYQLPSAPGDAASRPTETPGHLRGRTLFGAEVTYDRLTALFDAGAEVRTTKLTAEFDFTAFKTRYGAEAIPLFLIGDGNRLTVFATDNRPAPKPGHRIVSLIARPALADTPAPPSGAA